MMFHCDGFDPRSGDVSVIGVGVNAVLSIASTLPGCHMTPPKRPSSSMGSGARHVPAGPLISAVPPPRSDSLPTRTRPSSRNGAISTLCSRSSFFTSNGFGSIIHSSGCVPLTITW